MAYQATLVYSLTVTDPNGTPINVGPKTVHWTPGTGGPGVLQEVTILASTTTSLSVPSGAKFLLIQWGSTVGVTLKGNAADVGLPLLPSSLALGLDTLTPVSGISTVVLLSSYASPQLVSALWL